MSSDDFKLNSSMQDINSGLGGASNLAYQKLVPSMSHERLNDRLNKSSADVFPLGRSRSQEGLDTLRLVASRSVDQLNALTVRNATELDPSLDYTRLARSIKTASLLPALCARSSFRAFGLGPHALSPSTCAGLRKPRGVGDAERAEREETRGRGSRRRTRRKT